MKNVEVHIFPGVEHGYMMRENPKAFDQKTRDLSMERALAILNGLRGGGERMRKAGVITSYSIHYTKLYEGRRKGGALLPAP